MQVVFGSNLAYEGGLYGNAMLSRLPILEHRNHALPNPSGTEPRGVLEVRLSTGGEVDETPLTFLATHLDNRDEENRLASAKWINAFVRERQDAPLLLAGDLNAVPGSAVLEELARSWSRSGEAPMPTVPVEDPRRQIDYILYRPAGRWRTVEAHVLEEPIASDHLPILAVLDFFPAASSVGHD
jgi:endonuclease/exonuclease/phosphatase family metal-dependent hydrolase